VRELPTHPGKGGNTCEGNILKTYRFHIESNLSPSTELGPKTLDEMAGILMIMEAPSQQ